MYICNNGERLRKNEDRRQQRKANTCVLPSQKECLVGKPYVEKAIGKYLNGFRRGRYAVDAT